MPSVVFDASTLVGALLKAGSVPERALLVARSSGVICEVFTRPKFAKYLTPERTARILDLVVSGALYVAPAILVTDCRDKKDNKYLELALAAKADIIVASDADLLVLTPWRGIEIMTPAAYVGRFDPATATTGPDSN
jgi:putative PIN family toxin of toxin-antitoxin system